MNLKKPVVVVIDSGVKDKTFPENLISGFKVACVKGKYQKVSGFTDQIGHGTAAVDELIKDGPEYEQIIIIQIYEESMETDSEALLFALKEVVEISCDLVLISSGSTFPEFYLEMADLVQKITAKGTTIISALDNEGAVSFPAAFPEVIGVGTILDSREQPQAISEGPVNLVLPNRFYRLQWVSPPKIIIQGSSFGAAHITALWAKALAEDSNTSREVILQKIAGELGLEWRKSSNVWHPSWQRGQEFVRGIHKAVVFPWNKEIHSLARFQELLSFNIEGFYDLKYGLHLGRKIGELLGMPKVPGVIENYEDLDWSGDFDTVICGHCTALSQLVHRNLVQEIGEKCRIYGKRLYAFDREFKDFALDCFVPEITSQDLCELPSGRLYNRLTPVVGIVGTSSAQGKFTVQMELRKHFLAQGYSVGQIVSEPSGYLFGCEGVFPFGYHGSVAAEGLKALAILNRMVWEASDFSGKEVVLAGAQSGVVPYSHHNLAQYNFGGYDFLCGINPDVFVLCVNAHDPLEYIKRSIQYLYSFNGMSVAALVLFPVTYEAASQLGYGYKKRFLTIEEQVAICSQFSKELGIPTFSLQDGIEKIFDCVIEQLSE